MVQDNKFRLVVYSRGGVDIFHDQAPAPIFIVRLSYCAVLHAYTYLLVNAQQSNLSQLVRTESTLRLRQFDA